MTNDTINKEKDSSKVVERKTSDKNSYVKRTRVENKSNTKKNYGSKNTTDVSTSESREKILERKINEAIENIGSKRSTRGTANHRSTGERRDTLDREKRVERQSDNKTDINRKSKRDLENGESRKRATRKIETTERVSKIDNSKNPDLKFEFKKPNLKIIPLGGLGKKKKNITVFEYDDEIVLVDCGLEFPEDNMLGVDLVIPDVTYLVKNQEKIKGLVITHGHEDHIGSIPYVLKQVDMPIYATRLTVGLIQNKLEEHKLLRKTRLHTVDQGQTVNLGKMQVEFIRSSHSIPDSVMLAIHTPVGTVMHTGDFKIDLTPIDDQIMDFGRIAEIGNKGVLALLSDSTNSERKGYTMSESSVGEVFEKLFQNCTKRMVIATFASNVHRVQQILNCSVKNNRKVAVCGRSMINMIEVARNLGYIQVPENTFIDIDMIKNYPDEQLTILTTGSQGEAMSALTRMAAGEHKKVEITPNDKVIISATAIPGNEKLVSKVIDKLMQIGAEVVYSALEDIHVSGHAC